MHGPLALGAILLVPILTHDAEGAGFGIDEMGTPDLGTASAGRGIKLMRVSAGWGADAST
jgi:hypothetical protein